MKYILLPLSILVTLILLTGCVNGIPLAVERAADRATVKEPDHRCSKLPDDTERKRCWWNELDNRQMAAYENHPCKQLKDEMAQQMCWQNVTYQRQVDIQQEQLDLQRARAFQQFLDRQR